MACIACGRGLFDECTSNCAQKETVAGRLDKVEANLLAAVSETTRGRPHKEDEEIIDPHSTGRKRAAELYPLDPNGFCEWRDLANCGGGRHPIVGCATGLQRNRHHGPDKNTLNNAPENVHRICPNCHNRWHAANDKEYDSTVDAKIKHDPRPATAAERIMRITEEMADK